MVSLPEDIEWGAWRTGQNFRLPRHVDFDELDMAHLPDRWRPEDERDPRCPQDITSFWVALIVVAFIAGLFTARALDPDPKPAQVEIIPRVPVDTDTPRWHDT